MSIYDEIEAGVRHLEAQQTAFGGRVLVFGPGDKLGKAKRRNLIKRLKRRGFEAYTSEQLSRAVPSFINGYQ